MSDSNSGNVGIVIVSHSSKIAEGAADMVRQMVGNAVPLAWTGGDTDGGLGTNVAGILEAIEAAWSPAGVAILGDLGGGGNQLGGGGGGLGGDRGGRGGG